MSEAPVKLGQVWKDNDKRGPLRYLQVVSIDAESVKCRQVRLVLKASEYPWSPIQSTRESKIKISRFRPTATGYVLVDDGPGTEETAAGEEILKG